MGDERERAHALSVRTAQPQHTMSPRELTDHSHFGQAFEEEFYGVVGRNAKDGYVCVKRMA